MHHETLNFGTGAPKTITPHHAYIIRFIIALENVNKANLRRDNKTTKSREKTLK